MKKSFLFFCFSILMVGFANAQIIKGNYAIKNVQTGMLLRVKDASNKNGTPLVAYDPQNWKCMTWDFKNVDGNTYQLRNLFTGKTFQPKKSTETLFNLEEQPLVTGDVNQQYEFIAVGSAYMIKLKGTELFLTPEDKKGSTNSNIVLAKKTNTKDQYWTIYEQSPTM